MKISKEQIDAVNKRLEREDLSWDQGIFSEPNGIPISIKEPVVYVRWESKGAEGGSCWGGEPEYFENTMPEFFALDYLLEEVAPNIKFLQYKRILNLIDENNYHVNEYYGNWNDTTVKFIKLSDIEEFLTAEKENV